MTEKDKKIRKIWLISYIVITLISIIDVQTRLYKLNTPVPWPISILSLIVLIIGLYIYYRCAYKKPGTKLLTLNLVLVPISLIINVVFYIQSSIPFAESVLNPIRLAAIVWLYVLTWKVRAINKRLQGKGKSA